MTTFKQNLFIVATTDITRNVGALVSRLAGFVLFSGVSREVVSLA